MCLIINVSDFKEWYVFGICDFFCIMTIVVDEYFRVFFSFIIDSDGFIFCFCFEYFIERV